MPTEAAPVTTDNSDINLASPVEDDPFNVKGLAQVAEEAEPVAKKTTTVAERATPAEKDSEGDKLPPRLRGKSQDEIVEEFRGLEREYSRQGNELGESRQLLRQTLEQVMELANKPKDTQHDAPAVTEDDFVTNPVEAVSKIVAKQLEPLMVKLGGTQQEASKAAFAARHPGYLETARSADFQQWVADSAYRTKVFKAASGFDMDAAEELFSAWDEKRAPDEIEEVRTEKVARLRRSSVEAGTAGRSAGQASHKKVYKSSDLARLYITDREAYNAMMPEISQALVDGRVR